MRILRLIMVLCLLLLFAAAAPGSPFGVSVSSATATATATATVTTTELPVNPAYEPFIAVDPVGAHVFVTGGRGTSSIYVLDFDGNLVKTITGENGASGMAVDTETHTLYVADYDATAIAQIDTQTLTETSRFSTAPYSGPYALAVAGGKIWFSTDVNNSGVVASANLDGTNVADSGLTTMGNGAPGFPVFLTGSPDGTKIAFGYHEDEPSAVEVYDVTGSTPSHLPGLQSGQMAQVRDIAFDPSGSHILLATGFPYYVQELSTSTGYSTATYPTGAYPTAVAVSADGFVAADNFTSTIVYPWDDTTPVQSWSIVPYQHGLAFSPDGQTLFVLTRSNGNLALDSISFPGLTATTTSLVAAAGTVDYGAGTTLTAHVTGTTTGTVELDSASPGGSFAPIATGEPDANGDVSWDVSPTQNTSYVAHLKRGSTYASSVSDPLSVSVSPAVTGAVDPASTKVAPHPAAKVLITGTITPARPSETLRFVVQRYASGAWKKAATLTASIGPDGTAHAKFVTSKKGSYRVEVLFDPDQSYSGATSSWVLFKVH